MATITAAGAPPFAGARRISSNLSGGGRRSLVVFERSTDGKPIICLAKAGEPTLIAEAAESAPAAAIMTAEAAFATMASWNPGSAAALVDERLSTEGTGLSLGISNNLLTWIIVGVFALIWSFYIVYTSSLEEDEDSGLSL